MALKGRTRAIIFSSIILALGIIHLGVGIGIVAKYRQYSNVFQQQLGISGFNIVIGICAMATGTVGLVATFTERLILGKYFFC